MVRKSVNKTREKEIPEKKLKAVEELTNLIKTSKSLIMASIKNLPARQFQLIKKGLIGKAVIKVPKKNIIMKAIDNIKKEKIKNLKEYLISDISFIFSELDTFKLSALLSESKTKTRAKIGQFVDEDIPIEPGPTDLVPGPIISQLSNLGIKFTIEDGKINITERKIIVKLGEKVSENAVDIMAKLDIKPISVGLDPLLAYEYEEDKIYENIKIDKKKTREEITQAYSKSLAFAVKITYYCKETISHIIRKALSQEKTLEKFIKAENPIQENTQSGG